MRREQKREGEGKAGENRGGNGRSRLGMEASKRKRREGKRGELCVFLKPSGWWDLSASFLSHRFLPISCLRVTDTAWGLPGPRRVCPLPCRLAL